MDSRRRSRVKRIWRAALGRRPEERSRFLDEACGTDGELRREVESLLYGSDDASGAKAAPEEPAGRSGADGGRSGDPLIGTTLGRYRILRLVGRGGMGTVYEAEDPELGRRVALKLLPPEVAENPGRLERFRREARSAAALSHPNVVTLYSVEQSEGTHFLTMEMVRGEPLDRLLRDHGLPPAEILDRAIQLAEGLRAAHEAGIIHRDLKPANLMVDPEGRLRILDFGLAQSHSTRPVGTQADTSIALTAAGTVLGTASYMSPEQVAGKTLDHRSDLFSVGSILYEMATGRSPFAGETPGVTAAAILHYEPPPLREVRDDLPDGLQRIVSRCLAKDPAERYASARELRDALEALRRASARTGGWPGGGWIASAAVLGTLLLIGLLVVRLGEKESARVTEAAPAEMVDRTDRRMIVVLPFENLGSPEDEYFAAGMTHEITSRLSKVEALGVISTNTAFEYAASGKSTAQIGAELGVEYLVSGTVRWARQADGTGSRIRIEPRLVRVNDDLQTWSETYDRRLDDVFAIQTEIARAVVAQLGITLGGPGATALEERPTDDLEAYQAYLRAAVDRGRDFDCDIKSERIANLERAVALDPGFDQAWSRLARLHSAYFTHCDDRSAERRARAREARDRAMQLAPDSVSALVAAATFALQIDQDYPTALAWIEAAGERVNNEPWALAAKASILRRQGRWSRAIEAYLGAARLEPRSVALAEQVASSQMWVGDYAAALESFDRALSLSPDSEFSIYRKILTHWLWKGDTRAAGEILDSMPEGSGGDLIRWARYWQAIYEGRYREALNSLESAGDWVRSDLREWPRALLAAYAYRLLGEPELSRASFEEAKQILESRVLSRPWADRYHRALSIAYAGLGLEREALAEAERAVSLYPLNENPWFGITQLQNLALIHTMAGRYDAAFDALTTVLSEPSLLSIPLLKLDPRWEPLRQQPRFRELEDRFALTRAFPRRSGP